MSRVSRVMSKMSQVMSNLSSTVSKMSLKGVKEQPNEVFAHSAPSFERVTRQKISINYSDMNRKYTCLR